MLASRSCQVYYLGTGKVLAMLMQNIAVLASFEPLDAKIVAGQYLGMEILNQARCYMSSYFDKSEATVLAQFSG